MPPSDDIFVSQSHRGAHIISCERRTMCLFVDAQGAHTPAAFCSGPCQMEGLDVWNTIYVYGDHAYRRRSQLEECEHISPDDAERVQCFGLPPRYIYRVVSDEFEGL